VAELVLQGDEDHLAVRPLAADDQPGGGHLGTVAQLKEKNLPIAYVGDVVGTGSSRKSAINSLQWHMGADIPHIPNKRTGGIVLGSKIAPIFFNTAEDSGALPIECDVSTMNTGDVIVIHPYQGQVTDEAGKLEKEMIARLGRHGETIARLVLFADVLIGAVLVPGGHAPYLVTKEMVASMKPGSSAGASASARPWTRRRSSGSRARWARGSRCWPGPSARGSG